MCRDFIANHNAQPCDYPPGPLGNHDQVAVQGPVGWQRRKKENRLARKAAWEGTARHTSLLRCSTRPTPRTFTEAHTSRRSSVLRGTPEDVGRQGQRPVLDRCRGTGSPLWCDDAGSPLWIGGTDEMGTSGIRRRTNSSRQEFCINAVLHRPRAKCLSTPSPILSYRRQCLASC